MPGGRERIVVEGALVIPYRYALGSTASRFYVTLREEARLLGTRCGRCGKVYMPPVSTCIDCFEPASEWVDLPETGTVTAWTVMRRQSEAQSIPVPIIYARIRIDGADTDLVHILGEVEPESVKTGMRVRAVFREDREGNILDIARFAPAGP